MRPSPLRIVTIRGPEQRREQLIDVVDHHLSVVFHDPYATGNFAVAQWSFGKADNKYFGHTDTV